MIEERDGRGMEDMLQETLKEIGDYLLGIVVYGG
jgi:hypothetical protein